MIISIFHINIFWRKARICFGEKIISLITYGKGLFYSGLEIIKKDDSTKSGLQESRGMVSKFSFFFKKPTNIYRWLVANGKCEFLSDEQILKFLWRI